MASTQRDPASSPIRRRYHLHVPGLVYVGVTLFIAIGAINGQNNLLFAALGLAIGALLVSGLLSGASMMGLRVERLPATVLTVGTPSALAYRVSSVARLFPAFAVHLEELPHEGVRAAPLARAFIPLVGAGDATRVTAPFMPHRRGILRLARVRLVTTFPFGITKKSATFALDEHTLVLPATVPLRSDVVRSLTTRALAGLGSRPSPGWGEEFYGLREYTPGDSPRRIAWKPTARTGALVVRQDTSPAPRRLWIEIDDDPAASDEAFERAVALAASLMTAASDQGVAIGLAIAGRGIIRAPALSSAHTRRLMRELALLSRGGPDRPAAAAPRDARVVIHTGSAPAPAGSTGEHLTPDDLARLAAPDADPALLALLKLHPRGPDRPSTSAVPATSALVGAGA